MKSNSNIPKYNSETKNRGPTKMHNFVTVSMRVNIVSKDTT
jgi:hypothetical protein